MKHKKFIWYCVTVIMLLSMTVGVVLADDGVMFRKNISKTPDQETDRANINHMAFYVPAQTSSGEVKEIEYFYDGNETDVADFTRKYAKPLISVYIDELPEEGTKGGASFGAHDAYGALSLDDGATWKRTNLSNSAALSSFNLLKTGEAYPGDAHNMTFAIAGDKVLVGWISKYCDGGSPMYTMKNDAVQTLQENFGLPDLYVRDIWGVAGAQKSIDFEALGYPEVGEIPYSCVWSARGQLLPVELDDDGTPGYDIIWTKAERLTSGKRDANRLEMNGDSAAGFMMTWQEDPEGLRPGEGLGPGEGWSGAVVNQQTDLWYSFIAMDDFVMVKSDDTDEAIAIDIAAYVGDSTPKIAVPMAMPIRLTDNKMCKVTGSDPYCYVNFDDDDPYGGTDLSILYPLVNWDDPADVKAKIKQSVDSTFCTTTVEWTNPGGTKLQLCQTEDNRLLVGRVGASRPRVNVQPYSTTTIGVYDSAIVIMGAEESKALGEGSSGQDVEPVDIGKNMWYYSFDMLNPEFVMQGGMLNWPAKCSPYDVGTKGCTPGEPMVIEDPLYGVDNVFYETEISRRFSHMSQPIHQIEGAGISSVLIVKQGILNQGGPADIFLRLTQVPDEKWVPCSEDLGDRCLPVGYNPYAYENLQCDEWAFMDGSNPRYVQGLCLSTGINVSGGNIVSCDNGTSGDECAASFPWDGGTSPFPKVTEWEQTVDNLDDESWENPYDVAKGHRGFIDGDFIMMMYAWSPNWKANSVGNDHYNLYARRSFDGGATWTTTPTGLGGDGTETCENYKQADKTIKTICTAYGAGEFEQARNLSQMVGNKETILDPRYTPTGGLKMLPITDLKGIGFEGYSDDERDPSKFFIVYETGDNTTVAEGEAVPMDLFYSRATNWGDDYDLVPYLSSTGDDDTTLTWGFDWLEHKKDDLSGEAANTANNAGTFYYAIWNQWQEDEHENVSNSDAIFRRVMYLPTDDAQTMNLAPIARILYTEQEVFGVEEDQIIILIATARDLDTLNDDILDPIQEYIWTINGVVVPPEYQDDFKAIGFDCFNGKECKAPARIVSGHWDGSQFQAPGWSGANDYQYGWYEFAVQVKDNDDPAKYSKVVKIKKYIGATQFDLPGFKIFLPLTTK